MADQLHGPIADQELHQIFDCETGMGFHCYYVF
jgi:hypothetical protein